MASEEEELKQLELAKTRKTSSNLRNIRPRGSRLIGSYSRFQPSVSPHGYYKRFLRMGHIFKQRRSRRPGVDYIPGLYAAESTMKPQDFIKESITKSLQRKAVRHVNEYLRSPEGDKLKSKVNDIIKGKISEKKKVQNKPSLGE